LPEPIRYLTGGETASLDALVVRLEARTGVQIVPGVVGKSDSYPEVPWKAFAIGASFSGLGVIVADDLRPQWVTASTVLIHVIVILAVAATCALLAAFWPPIARLLVRSTRAHIEVRQHAESLFLRRGLFATRNRVGILVLVSLFEKRIEIIADTGFDGRVTEADWRDVITRMTPHLERRRPFEALRDALHAIEGLLTASGFRAEGAGDELPNTAIQERGV
jgi:putative membrane protein